MLDKDHNKVCRDSWLSELDSPLLFKHFTKNIVPPSSRQARPVTLFLSLTEPTTVMVSQQYWATHVLNLLATMVPKTRPGTKKTCLVREAPHQCVVPLCDHQAGSLNAIIHHLLMWHDFPLLFKAGKSVTSFDVAETIHKHNISSKGNKLVFAAWHPSLTDQPYWGSNECESNNDLDSDEDSKASDGSGGDGSDCCDHNAVATPSTLGARSSAHLRRRTHPTEVLEQAAVEDAQTDPRPDAGLSKKARGKRQAY